MASLADAIAARHAAIALYRADGGAIPFEHTPASIHMPYLDRGQAVVDEMRLAGIRFIVNLTTTSPEEGA
jgi:hypothetical protein